MNRQAAEGREAVGPVDGPAPSVQRAFGVRDVQFLLSAASMKQFPKDSLPQVAFVGRSNVGKSSLLNCLANRKQLAHVSSTPGRTQLVNYFRVNGASYFVDLPGYGFARAPKDVQKKWERLITSYLHPNGALRAVVALFDARRERGPEDNALLDWLAVRRIPIIAVMTKSDKLVRSKLKAATQALQDELDDRSEVAASPGHGEGGQDEAAGVGALAVEGGGIPPAKVLALHSFSALNRQGREEILASIGQALASPARQMPRGPQRVKEDGGDEDSTDDMD